MQLIRLLVLTLCFLGLTIAQQSPVLIWGADIADKPSLPIVSSGEFHKVVAPLLEENNFVVVLGNNLRNKDLLCTDDNGKSCYARLQDVRDKTYYAAVENPIETLRKLGKHYYISSDNIGEISKHLETGTGKIIFVYFDDENQSSDRALYLKSHDSVIASITSRFGKNVIFMYASSPSTTSLKRQRRQASQDNPKSYVFRLDEHLLIYYKSMSITEDNKTPVVLEMKGFHCELHNATAMNVSLTTTNGLSLTFDIILEGGYFFMKNVMYNNVKLLSSNVYAPTDFSYFCGNLTLTNIPNAKEPVRYTLKWNYLQFQAPFGSTKNKNFAFGDAWHCVGFFTGGILSGLLIVALLLTITFIGVCWMMDINTMDRFDDPKGKTITINAND